MSGGVYYTKRDEEYPVFHFLEDCRAGVLITEEDRRTALEDRTICVDCVEMIVERLAKRTVIEALRLDRQS